MTSTLRVAMIGAGGMARRHLRALAAEPGVEIAAHVGQTPQHAQQQASEWGGRVHATVEDALTSEPIDAAWITVPPNAHGAIEHALIDRGVPFLVEKPLAADLRTAQDIEERVSRSGVIAAVGYHWRAMDTVPRVREVLADHPVRMVHATWFDRIATPVWWRREATGGGQIVEQATHLIDLARLLAGEAEVVGATAGPRPHPDYPDADVAGVSAALLGFESGARGVVAATYLLAERAAVQLQLVCDGLLITITRAGVTYIDQADRREVPAQNDPFRDEDRAFLQAIRTKDPSRLYSSYADALRTHALCCTIRDLAVR